MDVADSHTGVRAVGKSSVQMKQAVDTRTPLGRKFERLYLRVFFCFKQKTAYDS